MFGEDYSCYRFEKYGRSEGWVPKQEIYFSSIVVGKVGSVESGFFVVVVAVFCVLHVDFIH